MTIKFSNLVQAWNNKSKIYLSLQVYCVRLIFIIGYIRSFQCKILDFLLQNNNNYRVTWVQLTKNIETHLGV